MSRRWIPDRSKLRKYADCEEKRSQQYRHWRLQVKRRDNFSCQMSNGDCCGRLEVHHIEPWRNSEELRYLVDNGITLCHFHHPRKRIDEQRLKPLFKKLVEIKRSIINSIGVSRSLIAIT